MPMFKRPVEKWVMPKIESDHERGSRAYYLDLAKQYQRAAQSSPFAEKSALHRMATHYRDVAAASRQ